MENDIINEKIVKAETYRINEYNSKGDYTVFFEDTKPNTFIINNYSGSPMLINFKQGVYINNYDLYLEPGQSCLYCTGYAIDRIYVNTLLDTEYKITSYYNPRGSMGYTINDMILSDSNQTKIIAFNYGSSSFITCDINNMFIKDIVCSDLYISPVLRFINKDSEDNIGIKDVKQMKAVAELVCYINKIKLKSEIFKANRALKNKRITNVMIYDNNNWEHTTWSEMCSFIYYTEGVNI